MERKREIKGIKDEDVVRNKTSEKDQNKIRKGRN